MFLPIAFMRGKRWNCILPGCSQSFAGTWHERQDQPQFDFGNLARTLENGPAADPLATHPFGIGSARAGGAWMRSLLASPRAAGWLAARSLNVPACHASFRNRPVTATTLANSHAAPQRTAENGCDEGQRDEALIHVKTPSPFYDTSRGAVEQILFFTGFRRFVWCETTGKKLSLNQAGRSA